ncbi:MAG: hypothetical protein QOD80_554 [Verrucomicrobiota bacterium]
MKKVHRNTLIGQQGINLIATVLGEVGYLWTPTSGHSDAGIDGFVEIRNPETGEATNRIVEVQSKATTREWDNDTPESFEFRCDDRDLDYWLQGNAPVILVVSRPRTKEAYWVSIKNYFAELERRKSEKVRFDKKKDLFTAASASALAALAAPQDSGIYLAPPPIEERLIANLLPVAHHTQSIYIAETDHRKKETVWQKFDELGVKHGNAWCLREGKIVSFFDLRISPWKDICDATSVETFQADEWSLTNDPTVKNEFVHLLNLALRDILDARYVRLWQPRNGPALFHFVKTKDLSPRIIEWRRQKTSQRTVFGPHYGKKDTSRIIYYRHLAFVPRFVRFAGQWYLEITPTYHFTSDGKKPSRYRESYLSGIKRIEKHVAVRLNLEFWASFLTAQDLFAPPAFMSFTDLLDFQTDFGIPEEDWLSKADDEEKARLVEPPEVQTLLFQ